LLSYGVDQVDLFRRSSSYVDRILGGTKPGDLPVQFPTKFEMAVNLKTAKALGLSIPPNLLAIADEVIDRLCRGPERRGRVSVCGQSIRSAAGACGRRRVAAKRHTRNAGGEGSDHDHPHPAFAISMRSPN
jgi:hypothetical protein